MPVVQERGTTPADAVPVASWPFCLVYLHTQRCPCGGSWKAGGHRLEGHLERHEAQCEDCGRERPFWFDLSRVLGDPSSHERFEDLRTLFADGLDLLETGDAARALPRLEEVCAREPWFGLAWLHQGMALMMEGETERARPVLERAVGLIPLDPTARRALAGCYAVLDMVERADREEALAEALDDEPEG